VETVEYIVLQQSYEDILADKGYAHQSAFSRAAAGETAV